MLAAAGCGSRKRASDNTTSSTAPAIVLQTGALPTTSGVTTFAGLGALGSVAHCRQMPDLRPAFEQALQGTGGELQKELSVLQVFAAKAPAAIRPDVETIAIAYEKLAGALKGVNLGSGQTPDAATLAKVGTLATRVDSAAVRAADVHIQAWVKANCHR